ncbi:MAG: ATP-binding protein [Lachnospiraceae bacterium]|nr:ATP-binding protein [Lachnospiraceae bacterium]
MDNTFLFDFEFADRVKETAILHRFLDNPRDKVLWIYGESGTGKSFFIKECLKSIGRYKLIYVENTKCTMDGECIINLIDKMQLISNYNFYNFVKKYSNEIKALSLDLSDNSKILNSNILKYALSKNSYFVNLENEYNDFTSILKKYTEKALDKYNVIFVIDNLNQCDENSFNILLNLAKSNIDNPKCRFIFISTDSEYGTQPFEKKLVKELPYEHLCIPKIPDEIYFINMLPRQFDLENLDENDIKKIYFFCQGLPEKFQDLLANLDRKHAIDYLDSRIKFNRTEMLNYILSSSNTDLNIENYNPIERSILVIVICLGMPVRIDLLQILSCEYFKRMFMLPLPGEKCLEVIMHMQPKPLKSNIKDGFVYLYTDHDLTFNAALMYYTENNIYNMACDYIYEYLNNTKVQQFDQCYSNKEKQELFADLSFHAQHNNWIETNFTCGKYFYDNGNYIQANKYFIRLINVSDSLKCDDKILIGITLYEIGEYKTASELLSKIPENTVFDKYQYYIYLGKSYNMSNNGEAAVSIFDKAIAVTTADSDDETYAKYMKHLAMIQIPKYTCEAKEIYEQLVDSILNAHKKNDIDKLYQPSNAKLLKCCYDYYFNDEALELMEIAEDIAERCNDKIEKAAILHNKGFEYIRQNRMEDGKQEFANAFRILKNTKRHEAAYSLNNLAICKMFTQNYQEAIDDLKKALRFQKSYYLCLTAQTMLMQCYRMLGNKQYKDIKDQLADIIFTKKHEDPSIIRKLCMNLAMCECKDGIISKAKNYLEIIEDLIEDTSSEFRFLKLYEKLYGCPHHLKKNYIFKKSPYFNSLDFDPWFITLSHD